MNKTVTRAWKIITHYIFTWNIQNNCPGLQIAHWKRGLSFRKSNNYHVPLRTKVFQFPY